jgi:hypothetical protein
MEAKYKDKFIILESEDGDAASRITSFFVELVSAFDLLEEFCTSDVRPYVGTLRTSVFNITDGSRANELEDLEERVSNCSEIFMRETNGILAAQPERTLESESEDAEYISGRQTHDRSGLSHHVNE